LFAYCALHFAVAVITSMVGQHTTMPPGGLAPFIGRVFSAYWLLFYGVACLSFLCLSEAVQRGRGGE